VKDAVSEPQPSWCQSYVKKFEGAGAKGPPVPPWSYSFVSWVGSFCGIGTLGLLQTYLLPHIYEPLVIIIGSFGATAVLVYGQPQAPPSQPYNTLFGNTLGALVGISVYELAALVGVEKKIWLTGGLAVSLTIVGQEITQSQHPPGGATALLAALMMNLQQLHFIYVFCPGFLGPLILVTVSMLVNNMSEVRNYPLSWAHPGTPAPATTDGKEQPGPETAVGKYLAKFKGKGAPAMPRPPLKETFFSWLGAFCGIATLGWMQMFVWEVMRLTDILTIIGSFGAVSVLVYSLSAGPLSQPKNALLGDTIGAAVGVAVVKIFELCGLGHCFWLMGALAVSLTIVAQERTASVFPPGGATSLIFIIRSCAAGLPPDHPFAIEDVWDWYVLVPGLFGPLILVMVAMLTNNLSDKRSYPTRWWDGPELQWPRCR
jgi:CBS-domain-containing membrane protein